MILSHLAEQIPLSLSPELARDLVALMVRYGVAAFGAAGAKDEPEAEPAGVGDDR
jgi:hypothetical protein